MLKQTRTICLTLAIAMAGQPIALAQQNSTPGQPAPASSTTPNKSWQFKAIGITAGIGAGIGLISYAGKKLFSDNSPWSWQGTTLSAAGGLGGMALGTIGGALIGSGIGRLIGGQSAPLLGLFLGAALGALAGGIFGGLWAGSKGDQIAERNASASSAPASGGATATAPPGASTATAPTNGPGGASGALGGVITTP